MKHAYQRYPDLAEAGLTAQTRAARIQEYKRSGYNIVVIAKLLRTRAPESDQKKQKEWDNFALEMQQSGRQLINAAEKSDVTALKLASAKVGESCKNCHNRFVPRGLR